MTTSAKSMGSNHRQHVDLQPRADALRHLLDRSSARGRSCCRPRRALEHSLRAQSRREGEHARAGGSRGARGVQCRCRNAAHARSSTSGASCGSAGSNDPGTCRPPAYICSILLRTHGRTLPTLYRGISRASASSGKTPPPRPSRCSSREAGGVSKIKLVT